MRMYNSKKQKEQKELIHAKTQSAICKRGHITEH